MHVFWHLETQLHLFNYIFGTVQNIAMGLDEYSGQNTEDSTAVQF